MEHTANYASGVNFSLMLIGRALRQNPNFDIEQAAEEIRQVIRMHQFSSEERRQMFVAPLDSLLAGITNSGMKEGNVIDFPAPKS